MRAAIDRLGKEYLWRDCRVINMSISLTLLFWFYKGFVSSNKCNYFLQTGTKGPTSSPLTRSWPTPTRAWPSTAPPLSTSTGGTPEPTGKRGSLFALFGVRNSGIAIKCHFVLIRMHIGSVTVCLSFVDWLVGSFTNMLCSYRFTCYALI